MGEALRIRDLAISETGFVFDPLSGATYTVNATAMAVMEGLKNKLGREELIGVLRERFEVAPQADLHRDLDEFLQLLRRDGLLPADFRL